MSLTVRASAVIDPALGTIRISTLVVSTIATSITTSVTGIRIVRIGTWILVFRVRVGGWVMEVTGITIGTTIASTTITTGTTVAGRGIGEVVGIRPSCGEASDGGLGLGRIVGETTTRVFTTPTTPSRWSLNRYRTIIRSRLS